MINVSDIIEWDIHNWSKQISFFEDYLTKDMEMKKALALGERYGGISLYLASYGLNVICSDIYNPKDIAEPLHAKYKITGKIEYQAIDALNIPFENYFDLIAFKSVLGGIARNGNTVNKTLMFQQIYKSLKPGGILLFSENLSGSILHKLSRKLFVKWGSNWNYSTKEEIKKLLTPFKNVSIKTCGFLGSFGRTEKQRTILGQIDDYIEDIIPDNWHYIIFVYCKK